MARRLALAVALAAALLPVTGAGGMPGQTPKRGGTVLVGTYIEPACLNAYLERCGSGLPFVGNLMGLALRGAFGIGAGSTFEYDLVKGVDFTRSPPFTLTYHIRPEARWSDGTPITARDFVFTHEAIRSVRGELWPPDAEVWSWVRSVRVVDAKTVKVVLRARFSGWRKLFPHVLPAHALSGVNFSTAWLDQIRSPKTGRPVGSGPFLVERWERGHSVTFVRNPRYWKSPAHLDRVVVRLVTSGGLIGAEQVQLLRSGELDILTSNALIGQEIGVLRGLSGIRVRAVPGPSWEHIDIRVGPGGHPSLGRKAIRQALAYGVDRVALARTIFGQVSKDYPPSDSAVFPVVNRHYRPNWRAYRYRPTEVRRLLERERCRRGSDGIYVCDAGRLSLRLATTAAVTRRQLAAETIQRQLRQVGIEVKLVYVPGPILFSQVFASGDFDLVLFSYLQFPDSPGRSLGVYGCGAVQNIAGYCQRLVTGDLDQAQRILDETQQARVLNRADAQLAKDVPVLPLYQVPHTIANRTSIRGVGVTSFFDLFANAENWWLDD